MRTRIQLYMGKEGISMSNSIMMRLIKCLSIIMLVIGCVQPTSVQAYSPVLTETVQNTNNTNNTNNNASVTVQEKDQPTQNTLELFVITVLVTILILFFVGIVHKDLKI